MEQQDLSKVGMELKRLRTEHSYTQEQIANDLGCTVSFISNIENNRAKLNLRVLLYYAKLCNVTLDSILNAGEYTGVADTDEKKRSEARDAELLNIVHQFSVEEQDKIIKILKFINDM